MKKVNLDITRRSSGPLGVGVAVGSFEAAVERVEFHEPNIYQHGIDVNTKMANYRCGRFPDNQGMENMTTQDIRKQNLQTILEAEPFCGVQRALADAMGIHPNTLSRYFTDKSQPRKITDSAARLAEIAGKKPKGWMDAYHPPLGDPELDALYERAKAVNPQVLRSFLRALAEDSDEENS